MGEACQKGAGLSGLCGSCIARLPCIVLETALHRKTLADLPRLNRTLRIVRRIPPLFSRTFSRSRCSAFSGSEGDLGGTEWHVGESLILHAALLLIVSKIEGGFLLTDEFSLCHCGTRSHLIMIWRCRRSAAVTCHSGCFWNMISLIFN